MNKLLLKLEKLIKRGKKLTDSEVVHVSQEMDMLIVKKMKSINKKYS